MKKYFETLDIDWYKQRLTGAIFCAMVAFVILFLRLFHLQLVAGENYRRLSENNCIRLQYTDPPRGLIYDRHGVLLVENRPSFDLSIILNDAKPVDETIRKLTELIRTTPDEIYGRVSQIKGAASYNQLILKQDIGRESLAAIEARKYDLPGIAIGVKSRRYYVNENSAAHLIGYLGEINSEELKSGDYKGFRRGDSIGKFGVEKACEGPLRGERGGSQVEVDATGRMIRALKKVDEKPGANIYLTIDRRIQMRAEELLEGKAGAVVAVSPRTGEVIAMASSPSFNPNAFVSGIAHKEWQALISNPQRPMENKAIQGEYPPGSVYKIVTAIAGLEEGVIDENSSFFCPGFYSFGNRVFRCWEKRGHGTMDVVSAIEASCDVFFYQTGQKLGVDRLAWYAKACGLGSPTGVALDHEAPGLIPTANWKLMRTGVPWQAGETLSVAIGQGYDLVTPIQMACLTAAVANGGKRFRPSIVKKVETVDGRLVEATVPEIVGLIPATPRTLALVKKGLWRVVNGERGTARRVRIEDIDISGKTGTAQVCSRKVEKMKREGDVETHFKSHAWFVAFAPSDNPEIALCVLIEHGEHGSTTAGPIARELIKTYFEGGTSENVIKAQGDRSLDEG